MKNTALILSGLLMVICASGADCDKGRLLPAKEGEFAPVNDTLGQPATASLSFTEGLDKVTDTFVLGKKGNATYLYVHEVIKPNQDLWKRTPEDLGRLNRIKASPDGPCSQHDFTRSVNTGSGISPTAKGNPVYCFCGHGDKIRYHRSP